MKITVTFTDTGGAVPEGMSVAFQAKSGNWEISTPSDIEEISCARAECSGCDAVHRRYTGHHHLSLTASGGRAAVFSVPEAGEGA